ncbi:hypothetical protein KCP73_04920 [Salmonella enterica subsp. enterica]|nr:hypothetical protein KCP73_04920 [Salmonella enterica subsp. enterica]
MHLAFFSRRPFLPSGLFQRALPGKAKDDEQKHIKTILKIKDIKTM